MAVAAVVLMVGLVLPVVLILAAVVLDVIVLSWFAYRMVRDGPARRFSEYLSTTFLSHARQPVPRLP